ncbi:DUF6634 family protein [Tropicibacter oceani]|uniref:Uncharacterized protein n=1 Tax=Tropicibacter oceani TaxID=3058420 RepID=A0ABY8QL41_9RHOB|nr:DUF6634 family protein [Tropicibacter oceani]WGW05332.1 hypothetical protein QF118_07230 [Tropicibacter oceani]
MMNKTATARITLYKYRNAYDAVKLGPPVDRHDPDTAGMTDWIPVVRGKFLNLRGVAADHPNLGNRYIETSALVYLTSDTVWARTLSRWYYLNAPFEMPLLFVNPSARQDVVCKFEDGGFGLTVAVTQKLLALRPGQLTEMAREYSMCSHAEYFEQIRQEWTLGAHQG